LSALDEIGERHRDAVDGDGQSLVETDRQFDRLRFVTRVSVIGLFGWCGPRVFHGAALDGATPEVLVDRVDLLLRALIGMSHFSA
jgi:hypothetical protein